MACTLSNKCAKNLSKWTVLLQLIIKNVVTCFFWNTVCSMLCHFYASAGPDCMAGGGSGTFSICPFVRYQTCEHDTIFYKKLSYRWQTARRCFVKLLRYWNSSANVHICTINNRRCCLAMRSCVCCLILNSRYLLLASWVGEKSGPRFVV